MIPHCFLNVRFLVEVVPWLEASQEREDQISKWPDVNLFCDIMATSVHFRRFEGAWIMSPKGTILSPAKIPFKRDHVVEVVENDFAIFRKHPLIKRNVIICNVFDNKNCETVEQ